MSLEHLWAGWRRDYMVEATARARTGDVEEEESSCVFCRLAESGPPSEDNLIVWRGELTFVVMNAYPYASGHVLVLPLRHVGSLADLSPDESAEVWGATQAAVAAIETAYEPDGLNMGANLGRAAGAGLPSHVHLHVLPRWSGDTNFMTAVAETRVMPERRGHSGNDHQGRGRDDPTTPSAVKGKDRRPACPIALSEQHAGDHEARNHKEDVDADVPTGQNLHV
jgi:ATP adenylyltransferase